MTSHRQQRVAELLHQELSVLISTELHDPRLQDAMLNVTRVEVAPDLRNARVFVEHSLGHEANPQVTQALYHSEGFLRRALATLDLRFVPHLSFHIDETELHGTRVDSILNELASSESAESGSQNNAPDDTGRDS
jgi:ribosome-binding factor A